jgi:hypothetical protein
MNKAGNSLVTPERLADKISSKEDFLKFLDALARDSKINMDQWENTSLKDYFASISSFTESIDYYYKNNNIPKPNIEPGVWQLFADILLAGKYYE